MIRPPKINDNYLNNLYQNSKSSKIYKILIKKIINIIKKKNTKKIYLHKQIILM